MARVAVVTGVARRAGIGHACAAALQAAGYRVIGIDAAPPEPGTIWQGGGGDSGTGGSGAVMLQVDLSDAAQIAALPRRLRAEAAAARCDCLVNNAGVADPYMPSQERGAAERAAAFQRYLQVNLAAPFLLTEALAPLMPPGAAAAVVHIASTRAVMSEPHCEGYAAAKAGLLGLTHAQAASLAGRARVNCVLPGWIDTSGDAASLRPQDHAWHWTGSVGRPEDVAHMVCFLADGERSGFITGQQFVVDGGVTRRMVYPEE